MLQQPREGDGAPRYCLAALAGSVRGQRRIHPTQSAGVSGIGGFVPDAPLTAAEPLAVQSKTAAKVAKAAKAAKAAAKEEVEAAEASKLALLGVDYLKIVLKEGAKDCKGRQVAFVKDSVREELHSLDQEIREDPDGDEKEIAGSRRRGLFLRRRLRSNANRMPRGRSRKGKWRRHWLVSAIQC